MTTPTPSDAAMAAVREWNATGRIFCGTDAKEQHDIASALIIDRHFAPLREELARLKEALEKFQVSTYENQDEASALRCENTTLRASNDKLRAALEAITRRVPIMGSTGDYREGQLHALEACSEVARTALAPERKETT